MARLLLAFILVPLAELMLLIEIGKRIGTPATIGLIVVTGVVGASLARWQGVGVLRRVREEVAAGQMPASTIVDGIIILIAGAVLMTPGVLTDAFGFFCLTPGGRRVVKRLLRRRFERAVRSGGVRVSVDPGFGSARPAGREVRDVTPPAQGGAAGRLGDGER